MTTSHRNPTRALRPGWLLPVLLAGAAIAAGCGSDDTKQPAQLPNPASVFCESRGGAVDLSTGICTLPDGTAIDEWEYFRRESQNQTGIANPATVYCEAQGGSTSGPEPMCTLPDGTVVDAWELFRQNQTAATTTQT